MTDPNLTWEQAVRSLGDDPGNREFMRACFYDDPLIDAARRYHASTEWAAIRRELPDTHGTALDIGAGRGIASHALARDGWTVSALEPDPSDYVGAGAIRALAREAGVEINVVEEWGESLPFADAAFDVVFCRAVLHHARDLNALCREVARVLRPGGRFVAVREHVVTDDSELPQFLASHPLHHLYGGEHAYRVEEYRGAITGAGLNIRRQLNPMASDINLFPRSTQSWKAQVAGRLGIGFAAGLIPDAALAVKGAMDRTPGRLYSFIADKPRG